MGISKIDKNFVVETSVEREGLKFYKVGETPELSVHGVFFEDGCFHRMPQAVADRVNEGVKGLNSHTAGGRVRFITDSPYIAVNVKHSKAERFVHMTTIGTSGFDLYLDGRFVGAYKPPLELKYNYEGVIDISGGLHEVVLNMPLYAGVKELYIGLKEGCTLLPPKDYKIKEPIVYYGSSITQGGCASRPGNAYQNIVSRVLDAEQINLGFSGSAKGEAAVAEHIATLKMSAFVLDYDHNAPSNDHLKATHYPFYKTVREKHPDLPIVLLSRPKFHLVPFEAERLEIVRETYERALAEGDKNIYFIPGPELISPEAIETATVDGVHPNDSGFVSMATKLIEVLRGIFAAE